MKGPNINPNISKIMQFFLDKGNANFEAACREYLKDHFIPDQRTMTMDDFKIPKEKINKENP